MTVPSVDSDHVVSVLRSSNLLAKLPVDELRAVASEFRPLSAESGELLLRQGSPSGGFGFLIEGQVVVRINGHERTRLARGEVFGEIAALLEEPVSGDVVALGPVRYIFLEQERIKTFLTEHPHLCFSLLQGEARRLFDPTRWYSTQAGRKPMAGWTPDSWRSRPITQQPDWPNGVALETVLGEGHERGQGGVRVHHGGCSWGMRTDRDRPGWPAVAAATSAPPRSTFAPPTRSRRRSRTWRCPARGSAGS